MLVWRENLLLFNRDRLDGSFSDGKKRREWKFLQGKWWFHTAKENADKPGYYSTEPFCLMKTLIRQFIMILFPRMEGHRLLSRQVKKLCEDLKEK